MQAERTKMSVDIRHLQAQFSRVALSKQWESKQNRSKVKQPAQNFWITESTMIAGKCTRTGLRIWGVNRRFLPEFLQTADTFMTNQS